MVLDDDFLSVLCVCVCVCVLSFAYDLSLFGISDIILGWFQLGGKLMHENYNLFNFQFKKKMSSIFKEF